MQNIIEILKSNGIEVPEDKVTTINKAVAENYKTISEVEKKTAKLESERDSWKERAEAAEETVTKFDGIDPEKIQGEVEAWKKKAADAEENAKAQIYKRDFSDALKAKLETVKFTSEAAKRDVVAQIEAAGLTLRDGQILGLDDLITQIKKADASAFVDDQQAQLKENKAKFTTPMERSGGKTGTMTKDEIMAIKDRTERREAMLAHKDLFNGLE